MEQNNQILNQSYLNKYISQTPEDDQESFMDDYISADFLQKLPVSDQRYKSKIKEMHKRIHMMEQSVKLDPNRVDIGAITMFILTMIQYC